MKLVFRKNETEQVTVFQSVGGQLMPFSYTVMMKALLSSDSLEPPDIAEGFSTEEAESIVSMIDQINGVMADAESEPDSP